tara:strand:+ start:2639 stop:3148 length:510 start_codon:yes stop_codon:yes gene_type:complete
MKIKNRIVELKTVKASELLSNPKNWRMHPKSQETALKGVLEEIGFTDAVLARETKDGLMLIDGHLRKDVAPDSDIPVLILDVTAKEADKILATHDPLGAMADTNQDLLDELLEGMKFKNKDAQELLLQLNSAEHYQEMAANADGVEYDESIADSVTTVSCPECNHVFPV